MIRILSLSLTMIGPGGTFNKLQVINQSD